MNEKTFEVEDGQLFCRFTEINSERETVLFLHGLGESGLCFIESFQETALDIYNKVVPDLLGYGKSSKEENVDYSFTAQINRINVLLNTLGVDKVHVVGHSMGGDIGTQLCATDSERFQSLVNIEGDLTPDDRFITKRAIEADKNDHFDEWFLKDYCEGIVMEWGKRWPSCIRYAKSLSMCSSDVFLENVYEIYSLNEAIPNGCCGKIGLEYKLLKIPKVYCWGKESLSAGSRNFLAFEKLDNISFERAFHWVMLDRTEAFYYFLAGFLAGCSKKQKVA